MPATTETMLNLRELKCPLPALKVRKALTRLGPRRGVGRGMHRPLSAIDIPNLLRETGDVLEESRPDAGLLVFRIRKAAPASAGAGASPVIASEAKQSRTAGSSGLLPRLRSSQRRNDPSQSR